MNSDRSWSLESRPNLPTSPSSRIQWCPVYVHDRHSIVQITFHGQLFEPADAGYNEARQIWNASVNKHPRLIARCSGVADVIAAVNFGRDE